MKNELRIFAKNKRREINIEKISEGIVENIAMCGFFKNAKNVLIFYPKKYEINLLELMKGEDKNWFLPRCSGDKLEVCRFCAGDELKLSQFGVLEPYSESCDLSVVDLIIAPALAVDLKKHRLGYGKGYYDRLFKESKAVKAGVCAQCMILDDVYAQNHDMPCDYVVSEKGIF